MYILGIDQSTQGTKAIIFDAEGKIVSRADKPHRQIIDEHGFVEHDPVEIYHNVCLAVREVLEKSKIPPSKIQAAGLTNQRETVVAWERESGVPVYPAIVWQCSRAKEICRHISKKDAAMVFEKSGMPLSPYFSGAKLRWIFENIDGALSLAENGRLCCGTIDTWLLFRMTHGACFKTDYSNASRTQLFNIQSLEWDEMLCSLFKVPVTALPEVCDSNSLFGLTTLEGIFEKPVPVYSMMGDSQAALFGQGCIRKGQTKVTYGTGASVMMNGGSCMPQRSQQLATSLAWGIDGKVSYVLEGNINYAGACMKWLENDLGLIRGVGEIEALLSEADEADETYMIPAFTGLSAPYWKPEARAAIYGMGRTTGKAEIVKAAVESIAYQVADIISEMEGSGDVSVENIKCDGGISKNAYLMQFQSDILQKNVLVSGVEEVSCMGTAWLAGLGCGLYDQTLFWNTGVQPYRPKKDQAHVFEKKYRGWHNALEKVI